MGELWKKITHFEKSLASLNKALITLYQVALTL